MARVAVAVGRPRTVVSKPVFTLEPVKTAASAATTSVTTRAAGGPVADSDNAALAATNAGALITSIAAITGHLVGWQVV